MGARTLSWLQKKRKEKKEKERSRVELARFGRPFGVVSVAAAAQG
jgi:hypothetical protein